MSQYSYAAEKFAQARRNLMLPHSGGEPRSVMLAFHECSLALHDLDRSGLDDSARALLGVLESYMDTRGVADDGEGLWIAKARTLTVDDMIEISNCVDELAFWFYRASHEALDC